MIVKLLTEQHLEFLGLEGGCRGSSDSILVRLSHVWKSHALALTTVISYGFDRVNNGRIQPQQQLSLSKMERL